MDSETDLSEEKLSEVYNLNECLEWIETNNYRSIGLQFSKECLEYSSRIALILKSRTKCEFYISYSTMCCVDYLSVQHLNDSAVDAIVYFGSVCLSSSQFSDSLPLLYVFPNNYNNNSLEFIESSILEMESNNNKIIVLYNPCNALMALELLARIGNNDKLKDKLSIAKLNSVSKKWEFTESVSNIISCEDSAINLGQFSLTDKLENYDLVVYLGQNISLDVSLKCKTLLELDVINRTKRLIYGNKELRKRVALIEKFKQNTCESIGIIFTNPLPNVNKFCSESKKLGKKMGKRIYFITLVQTIDEYKLGNFPELNAFVVINNCFCSSALNSIDYCLPILNWTEFQLASGLPLEYGGVLWNDSPDLQTSDSEEPEVSDLSQQLIQTNVFDRSKWFGLEVNAGSKEASIVKSGQKGVASHYQNEDLL